MRLGNVMEFDGLGHVVVVAIEAIGVVLVGQVAYWFQTMGYN